MASRIQATWRKWQARPWRGVVDPITLEDVSPPVFTSYEPSGMVMHVSAVPFADFVVSTGDLRHPTTRRALNTPEVIRLVRQANCADRGVSYPRVTQGSRVVNVAALRRQYRDRCDREQAIGFLSFETSDMVVQMIDDAADINVTPASVMARYRMLRFPQFEASARRLEQLASGEAQQICTDGLDRVQSALASDVFYHPRALNSLKTFLNVTKRTCTEPEPSDMTYSPLNSFLRGNRFTRRPLSEMRSEAAEDRYRTSDELREELDRALNSRSESLRNFMTAVRDRVARRRADSSRVDTLPEPQAAGAEYMERWPIMPPVPVPTPPPLPPLPHRSTFSQRRASTAVSQRRDRRLNRRFSSESIGFNDVDTESHGTRDMDIPSSSATSDHFSTATAFSNLSSSEPSRGAYSGPLFSRLLRGISDTHQSDADARIMLNQMSAQSSQPGAQPFQSTAAGDEEGGCLQQAEQHRSTGVDDVFEGDIEADFPHPPLSQFQPSSRYAAYGTDPFASDYDDSDDDEVLFDLDPDVDVLRDR